MYLHICPIIVGQIFVLSSYSCHIVIFIARLLWHLCSVHLSSARNHNANILLKKYKSCHVLFFISQVSKGEVSGYPGISDQQILFNHLLLGAQKQRIQELLLIF